MRPLSSYDFRTEFARFFDGVDRHIARSADRYRLAPHGVAARIEGLLAQIHKPVPRRFLSHKTAAVGKAFAGEHADVFVAYALILPHEEAYLAAAHAVRLFLKICSKPRNFITDRLTEGWNLKPPLYGPIALLNCTR